MLGVLLFLLGVRIIIYLINDKKQVINEHETVQLHQPTMPGENIKANLNHTNYYIVREYWDYQHSGYGVDYIFCPLIKIFQRKDEEESKRAAEKYYAERLKVIALRRLMFYQLEKEPFTLALSYIDPGENDDLMEVVLKTTNEHNLPIHDDFKDGLYRIKKPVMPL